VRAALHAVLDGQAPIRASLEIINRASADARRSPIARWRRGAPPVADVDLHVEVEEPEPGGARRSS
jgi:hypothetical protein